MISSINNYALSAYASQRQSTSSAVDSGNALAGGSRAPNTNENAVDFSNMTANELRSWANNQFKSGKITVDECMAFGAMTMSIPVSGNSMQNEIDLNTKTNFVEKLNMGIEGAASRNDHKGAQQLQSILDVMRRSQRGIDYIA